MYKSLIAIAIAIFSFNTHAAIPYVKIKPALTAAIPYVKIKPVETAAIPYVKIKPQAIA